MDKFFENKLFTKIEDVLMPFSIKVNKNPYLTAIREGFMLTMPFLLVGSLMLLIASLPIPGYAEFLTSVFGENWASYFYKLTDATFGITALIAAFGVARTLAREKGLKENHLEIAGMLAVVLFVFFTPQVTQVNADGTMVKGIEVTYLSASGSFTAMILGIFPTMLYCWFIKKDIKIKMPEAVPSGVAKSFESLIPIGVIFCIAIAIQVGITALGFSSLSEMIYTIIQKPLMFAFTGWVGMIFGVLIEQIFWFFGIHGGLMYNSIMGPIADSAAGMNYQAYLAGDPMPYIYSSSFRNVTNLTGGSGNTLALIAAILLVARRTYYGNIAKLALIPNLFNINEPILFGIPVILNPVLLIPWIVGPVVTGCLTYFLMAIGLVAIPNGIPIPWTTPIFINGYILGGWSLVIMQAINLVILTIIWIPFVKVLVKTTITVKEEKGELNA